MHSGNREHYGQIACPEPGKPRLRTGKSFLERMGVLYADRIRLNIVAELYMREMGPKQFFEQVGGTSYASVHRHFLRLTEHGWLRRVRTEPSARGRPEDIYRSSELAVIDDETWALIPTSIRDAFTVQVFLETGERLIASLSGGAFDSRNDNVLSFNSLELDERGCVEIVNALNGCFRALAQEQTDAKVRLERFGDLPVRMAVALGGFKMPRREDGPPSTTLPAPPSTCGVPPWPRRISKVFSDPLNLEIISRLNDSAMSPAQLHRALGDVSVEAFQRRCKMLVEFGWVAKVEQRTGGRRRGGRESFYRATSSARSQGELFCDLPNEIRLAEDWRVFDEFCQQALDAVQAGTFNRWPERHLTLSTLLVDEVGWGQVLALLRSCTRSLARAGEGAAHRIQTEKAIGEKQSVGCFVAGFCERPERAAS